MRSVDCISDRIGLRDLLELGGAVIDNFRFLLKFAGDLDCLRNICVRYGFFCLFRSLDVRQDAFLTVLGVHLIEAGGKLVW